MFPLKQSTASQKVPVRLFDSTDHVTAETGISGPTITASKAGGALASLSSGTWANLGGGAYSINLDATDTNTVGWLLIRVVATGCDDAFVLCWVHDSSMEVDLVDAPNSTAIAAVQSGLATSSVQATIAADVAGIDGEAMRGTDGAYTGTPPTAAAIKTEMDDNSTKLAAILADVTGLDGDAMVAEAPTAAAIRAEIDSNSTQLAAIVSAIGSLNDVAVSDILAGVLTGTYTVQDALLELVAVTMNKLSVSGTGPYVITYRNNADDDDLVVLTIAADGSTRTIARS